MKIKRLAAILSAVALFATSSAAVLAEEDNLESSGVSEAPVLEEEGQEENVYFEDLEIAGEPENAADFFEDFEGYEELGDNHSLVDTMNDLYAGGWSVVTDNQFTERNESDSNQRFAKIVNDDGNKVLELSTSKSLGRMIDPSTETPSGSYEISFKFKPVDLGKKQMLFDLSLNSFNEASSVAKHNILYSYNGMRMGHRTNSINVPMTQVGTPEAVWYDVKCTVNNNGGYYSVELYKEGTFVARRGGINYAGEEKIGFLKLSGFGTTILVDDVSIRPCEPEMLIYADDFDSYSEVRLPASYVSVGAEVSESQSREGESFFEGYTPWRALRVFGNSYDLVYDPTLESQVVRLGDDSTTTAQESTGMIYMSLDGDLLTKESQTKRGKLKLSYKFRHYSQNGYASAIDIISDYRYSGKWDYPPQMAVQEKGLPRPAVAGLPYLRTSDAPVKINQDKWYEADVIFDVINDKVTVIVREGNAGAEIANFTHNTNWINPDVSPTYDKVKGLNFRAVNGSAVYIDDVRLEYYITDPQLSGNSIIITDHNGERAADKNNVPTAITSIELPFGCEMTAESTNTETVVLSDSKGNQVSYTPVYDLDSYSIIPDGFLTPGETYTLTVPATAENTFGCELGEDFEYSFKTAPSHPELMTVASVSIEALSELRNGQVINAEISYVNTSDGALNCLPFIAYYGNDMLLATSSVRIDEIGIGDKGSKTVSFTVPGQSELDISRVDKISVCLWKGFKNSAPYCGETDIEEDLWIESAAESRSGGVQKPEITYSYNDSVLCIKGTANEESRYLTVQILKPGSSFDEGDTLEAKAADALVFYRGQIPVSNGEYSLDIRFDSKDNTGATPEAGEYPTAIYLDDKKLDTESVYISSYSDYAKVCGELNAAAASDDFNEFKNILNNKRRALNFNNELLGNETLGNEIGAYYEYVKKNPLNAENETENSEMFNTYIVMEHLNGGKLESAGGEISKLLIDEDVKALCDKVLTTNDKDRYFTGLISGKSIDDPEKLEKNINTALILTAAKYGNGYGELKEVLEICGSDIGITTPISQAACRALIGKTFKDARSFKNEYDKNIAASASGGGGGGGSASGGSTSSGKSGTPASTKPSMASVEVPLTGGEAGGSEVKPLKRTFNDIDNYEWAMTGILGLADRDIINGVDDDRFEPARNIKREEFVKILVGALGESDHEYDGNIYADASYDDWFVKHINIAARLGIANGIGDGMFGTGNYITRQDMAVMIYNALRYRNVDMTVGSFRFDDDGQIADYAKDAVAALHDLGAINGVTDTTFEPTGLATRAQAAKIIYSVLNELQG